MKPLIFFLVTTSALAAFLPVSDDFAMTVMDAFAITNVGVAVTGIVAEGPVAVDQTVCLRPAEGAERELVVQSILNLRQGRESVASAEPGTMVALIFEELESDDVERGDRLTASCDA